ncbi:MAG: four helix bundle protein [Lewinellaceae bacterium]|nr:four helix bundle protein [Lewinellaceae bacterium]
MRNFRDYEIWNIGMDLVVDIYNCTASLPGEEKYGLQSQMRRSAVSMPSNIAEGCSRRSDKEFARFLEIALGSSFELETQLFVGIRIGYWAESDLKEIFEKLDRFQRKTNKLWGKLR